MTGYIVHYSDGGTDMMRTVLSSSTSYDITGLTDGSTYTISVEATSQHLSGVSQIITLRMCYIYIVYKYIVYKYE